MTDPGYVPRHRRTRLSRPATLAVLAAVVVLVVSVFWALDGRGADRHRVAASTSASSSPSVTETSTPATDPVTTASATTPAPRTSSTRFGVPSAAPSSPAPAVGVPSRLSIPAIGVDTSLESLSLAADGTLEAPRKWQEAGWFVGSSRPGQAGPAVIAGHVDSRTGPAVFYRLHQLHAGDRVLVHARDDSTVSFVVDTLASYPKNHFPSAAVYGPTPLPELRLITCAGDFNFVTHNYLDNLVVSAHQA